MLATFPFVTFVGFLKHLLGRVRQRTHQVFTLADIASCQCPGKRSGGFDTGAAAVRLPAIGRPSQVARVSPMEPPRGVPVSNPPRPQTSPGFRGPWSLPSRQPTGDRGQPGGSGAGARLCRPSRRRERPFGAALNLYRKFSQDDRWHDRWHDVMSRLILYTWASLDA